MTIYGWDASDFDWDRGPMDLAAARADGIDFFSHKATESTHVIHRNYGAALGRARAAGIPFLGAYIVVRSTPPSVQEQCDYFLSYLDAETPWWRTMPEFFLQVDLEHWDYDHVDSSVGEEAIEYLRTTGHWAILYAPKWAYGDSIGGDAPLWASNYGDNPPIHYRDAYPGDDSSRWGAYSGRVPTFLQYGSTTHIGSQPTCDANAYRGTLAELRSLITQGKAGMSMLCRHGDQDPDDGMGPVTALQCLGQQAGYPIASTGLFDDATAQMLRDLNVVGWDTSGCTYGPSEYAKLHAYVARLQAGAAGGGIPSGATVTITGTINQQGAADPVGEEYSSRVHPQCRCPWLAVDLTWYRRVRIAPDCPIHGNNPLDEQG